MAAADFTAIEYVLDREVDVDTLRLAGNFDAVAKGRHEPCAQQDPQYCGMRWFRLMVQWLTPFLSHQVRPVP